MSRDGRSMGLYVSRAAMTKKSPSMFAQGCSTCSTDTATGPVMVPCTDTNAQAGTDACGNKVCVLQCKSPDACVGDDSSTCTCSEDREGVPGAVRTLGSGSAYCDLGVCTARNQTEVTYDSCVLYHDANNVALEYQPILNDPPMGCGGDQTCVLCDADCAADRLGGLSLDDKLGQIQEFYGGRISYGPDGVPVDISPFVDKTDFAKTSDLGYCAPRKYIIQSRQPRR